MNRTKWSVSCDSPGGATACEFIPHAHGHDVAPLFVCDDCVHSATAHSMPSGRSVVVSRDRLWSVVLIISTSSTGGDSCVEVVTWPWRGTSHGHEEEEEEEEVFIRPK